MKLGNQFISYYNVKRSLKSGRENFFCNRILKDENKKIVNRDLNLKKIL